MSSKVSDIRNSDEYSAEREIELQTLLEAYRIANSDRISYSEEMKNMLQKLEKEVEKMEEERADLLLTLKIADSKVNTVRDDRNCEDLANLAENKDWIDRLMDDEKVMQAELDSKIRETERKLTARKMKFGGGDINLRNMRIIKARQNLERRLQSTSGIYCEYLEANRKLREDIDNLRNDRKLFDKIYTRLDAELAKLKAINEEVVHSTTALYDHREELAAKLVQIREKAEKDTSQHNAEMKELVRIIDHDRKLRDFMNVKAQERPEDPQLIAYKERRIKEAEARIKAQEDSIESMENSFDRMRELMNQPCLDRLVDEFIEKEDRNYALFNYINVKHLEREKLQKEVEQLKEDISQHKFSSTEEEKDREVKVLEMDGKRAKIASMADADQSELNSALKTLDSLTSQISSLFAAIGCDDSCLKNTLGFNDGVTVSNIQIYMGLIEMRTNELLSIQNYIATQQKDSNLQDRMILIGSGLSKPGQTVVKVPTPSLNDTVGRGTDTEIPKTRKQLLEGCVDYVQNKMFEFQNKLCDESTLIKNAVNLIVNTDA